MGGYLSSIEPYLEPMISHLKETEDIIQQHTYLSIMSKARSAFLRTESSSSPMNSLILRNLNIPVIKNPLSAISLQHTHRHQHPWQLSAPWTLPRRGCLKTMYINIIYMCDDYREMHFLRIF